MSFQVVSVREPGDGDAWLYPAVTPDALGAQLGADDGNASWFAAKHLSIERRGAKPLELGNVKIDVAVTDSRVVFSCKKYEKGGGWVGFGAGGVAFMAVANTVSKVRAARRRRGNCLVGHVRYPWIVAVYHSTKSNILGRVEMVRLAIVDGTSSEPSIIKVDLAVTGGATAYAVANEISVRAARHRLASKPDLSEDNRAELERIVRQGIPRPASSGTVNTVKIPGAEYVTRAPMDALRAPADRKQPESPSSSQTKPEAAGVGRPDAGDTASPQQLVPRGPDSGREGEDAFGPPHGAALDGTELHHRRQAATDMAAEASSVEASQTDLAESSQDGPKGSSAFTVCESCKKLVRQGLERCPRCRRAVRQDPGTPASGQETENPARSRGHVPRQGPHRGRSTVAQRPTAINGGRGAAREPVEEVAGAGGDPRSAGTEAALARFCSACGREHVGNIRYCTRCGAPRRASANESSGGSAARPPEV